MGKRKAEEEAPMQKEKKQKKEKKAKKGEDENEDAAEATEAVETTRICVPIAHPLSTDHENLTKKVLSMVKHATQNKTMIRGIKEVTKIIRKEKAGDGSLVVLAADISPLDCISHMPILLEDKSVQYVWVPSRSDLGAATLSKRPTSAVIVKKVPAEKEDAYRKVVKVISKLHKRSD